MNLCLIVSILTNSKKEIGLPTFHALGVMSRTSSSANIPCGYMPCETYRSANSAHDSASVGDKSNSSLSAVIASDVFSSDLRTEMRRFKIGYITSKYLYGDTFE